jgi:hypothetical protein
MGILLDVNQDAARRALGYNSLVGYQMGMFRGDGARDDFAEGT